MSGTMALSFVAGYVALLLWGMHMVHTGVVRAYGVQLRKGLGLALSSRWKAFLAGLGITAVLQSSTATGLMTTSFIAGGLMSLVPALAVTLGANVGTTLIVQVLTFDVFVADMHQRVLDELHLASTVFMTSDERLARQLLGEKERKRDVEQTATENHWQRLREGRPQSIETSALHIDIVRDLKRIAAHIASVAYPILEQNGALRRSRLVD
jgi:Na+/phosphate symporter